jgi:hypothetical protein
MSEKELINIRCPHCFEDNAFNLSKDIKCKHCDKKLTNNKYIKPIISGLATFSTAAIIGIGSGIAVDEYFIDPNRYPVNVEYSIINSCISQYDRPLALSKFRIKKAVCETTLVQTQKKYNYNNYKNDKNGFLKEFESQADNIIKIVREKNPSLLY